MKRFNALTITFTILLASVEFSNASDPPLKPRNAALLYWQSVALIPELTDAEELLLNKTSHDKYATVPLNDTSEQLVDRCGLTLSMLRRGAETSECEWGVLWENGAAALMPHMGKARLLVRLAVLRARHHLQAQSPSEDLEAVEDLVAAIRLARHVGADNMLISQMVQNAMEQLVFEVTSQNLIRLDDAAKRLLLTRLEQMPDPDGLDVAIQREKDVFVGTLKKQFAGKQGEGEYAKLLTMFGEAEKDKIQQQASDAAAVIRLLDDMATRYNEASEIAKLPPDEIKPRWEALIKRVKAENIIADLMLPSVDAARTSEAKAETRREMLKAAIRVSLDQESESEPTKDPYGDGAFGMRNLDTGFVLVSGLKIDGLPFEVVFR